MAVRITCIRKDGGDHYDPHEAIQELGWMNESTGAWGISTLAQMVAFLEGNGAAYVKDAFGRMAYLVVRISRYRNKYVKTIADNRETDNLLYLSECKAG